MEPGRRLGQSVDHSDRQKAGDDEAMNRLPLLTAPSSHNVQIRADQSAAPDTAGAETASRPAAAADGSADGEDEYYQQYLAERERLRRRDT